MNTISPLYQIINFYVSTYLKPLIVGPIFIFFCWKNVW